MKHLAECEGAPVTATTGNTFIFGSSLEVIIVYLGCAGIRGIIFGLSFECDASTFASKIVIVLDDHTLLSLSFVVWGNNYLIRLICADIPGALLDFEIGIFTCTQVWYRKDNSLYFVMSTQ